MRSYHEHLALVSSEKWTQSLPDKRRRSVKRSLIPFISVVQPLLGLFGNDRHTLQSRRHPNSRWQATMRSTSADLHTFSLKMEPSGSSGDKGGEDLPLRSERKSKSPKKKKRTTAPFTQPGAVASFVPPTPLYEEPPGVAAAASAPKKSPTPALF